MKMAKAGKIFTGVAVVVLLGMSGCAGGAGGGYYTPSGSGSYYGYGAYNGSYIDEVPPSFYNNDPTLRQWFTAPYWNPEAP
jgi:hypothetical protein